MTNAFTRYEAELVTAADRLIRRRRTRRFGYVGAAGLAVLTAALFAFNQNSADASSITVERVGANEVIIRLARQDAPTASVTRDLAHAGFTVEEHGLTTGPSRVGEVVSLSTPQGTSSGDGGVRTPTRGTIIVESGTRGEPGEPYQAVTNAFDRLEPLACLGRSGMRVGELVSLVASIDGVAVHWLDAAGQPMDRPNSDDARFVRAGIATSDHTVSIFTSDLPPPAGPPVTCEH